MNVNFVGLKLLTENWDSVCKSMTERYVDDILISKASEEFKGHLYEVEPHVTLYYNEDCKIGPNMMYYVLTIDSRGLYRRLCNNKIINLPTIKLKVFDNPDFKVLVIDFSILDGEIRDIIYSYNENVSKLYGWNQDYPIYQPHVTITYLKKDFNESNLNSIEQYLNDRLSHQFQITDFMLGGPDSDKYNNLKLPII